MEDGPAFSMITMITMTAMIAMIAVFTMIAVFSMIAMFTVITICSDSCRREDFASSISQLFSLSCLSSLCQIAGRTGQMRTVSLSLPQVARALQSALLLATALLLLVSVRADQQRTFQDCSLNVLSRFPEHLSDEPPSCQGPVSAFALGEEGLEGFIVAQVQFSWVFFSISQGFRAVLRRVSEAYVICCIARRKA